MLPERAASTEWSFPSVDVAHMAGVSLRQMQWWDERQLVSPRIEGHRRVYITEQVLEILTVAALRRKGLSLQSVRKVLRLLRRELVQHLSSLVAGESKVYLITDGNSVVVDDHPDGVLNRIAEAKHSMYLVCLTDQMSRITSAEDRLSSRYRTKRIQLFPKYVLD